MAAVQPSSSTEAVNEERAASSSPSARAWSGQAGANSAPAAPGPEAGDGESAAAGDGGRTRASTRSVAATRTVERMMWAYFDEMWFLAIGSPRKVLRFQQFFSGCAIAGAVCFCLQIVIVIVFAGTGIDDDSLLVMVPILLFLFFPIGIFFLQLRFSARASKRCASIVRGFERFGERVADRLIEYAQTDPDLRKACRCSVAIVIWIFLSLLYEAIFPPCKAYNDFKPPWEYGVSAIPCETWELFLTVFLVLNLSLIGIVMILPKGIDRIRFVFTPEGRKGLPQAMLDLLGSFEYNADSDSTGTTEPTCTICIEDFATGDRIRRLPCGHEFHLACVDNWLGKKPTCPMRCHHDLWQIVRKLAVEKGIVSPDELGNYDETPQTAAPTSSDHGSASGRLDSSAAGAAGATSSAAGPAESGGRGAEDVAPGSAGALAPSTIGRASPTTSTSAHGAGAPTGLSSVVVVSG